MKSKEEIQALYVKATNVARNLLDSMPLTPPKANASYDFRQVMQACRDSLLILVGEIRLLENILNIDQTIHAGHGTFPF